MKHCRVTKTARACSGQARHGAVLGFAAVALGVLISLPRADAGLVLDDTLQGSTKGTRSGGAFVAGGWKVTGAYDCIYWHVPATTQGAVEWDVRGLQPNECRTGMEDKIEVFHMYDYTFGDSDNNYNGGYRDNPYKHFVRKIGCVGGSVDAMELVWRIGDEYVEPDTQVLSWSPTVAYHFREEWEPDGENSRLRIYRNGVLVLTMTLPGLYAPAGLSIRIAASTRRDPAAGAPVDAIYSNVKFWDLSASAPAAPAIAEVSPDPDLAVPGIEYSRQLVLEQGNPAPSWAILAGPPGLRIDSSGRLSGWTPATADLGSQFQMEVRAANSQGSDVESWLVEVAEARAVSFPFDSDVEGWALSVWQSGPYSPGTIAWESSGGHPGGCMRAGGAGDSNNQDTCTREGGAMTRVISTAGLRSMRVDYDVIASLGASPGTTPAGNCTVLEGSIEDKMVVYYSTRGVNGPWTRAEVISEPELPTTWAHRTADLSSISAAGDNPAFALRFQWQFNARDDAGSIDNVRVQGAVIQIETRFVRGDSNVDGRKDISDAVTILGHLFLGAGEISCEQAGDTNDDGALDISDAVYILGFLFLGGSAIAPPADTCGVDPTGHALPCESFPGCE